MPVVRDLLARKGTDIVSIQPTASVLEAARLMSDRGVGGSAAPGTPTGIASSRYSADQPAQARLSPAV